MCSFFLCRHVFSDPWVSTYDCGFWILWYPCIQDMVKLSFKVVIPFYNPTSSEWNCKLLCIFASICCCQSFDFSSCNEFNLHAMLNTFLYARLRSVYLLRWYFQILCLFLNLVVFLGFKHSLYISIQVLYQNGLSFHYINNVFCRADVFNFWEIKLILLQIILLVLNLKIIFKPNNSSIFSITF